MLLYVLGYDYEWIAWIENASNVTVILLDKKQSYILFEWDKLAVLNCSGFLGTKKSNWKFQMFQKWIADRIYFEKFK